MNKAGNDQWNTKRHSPRMNAEMNGGRNMNLESNIINAMSRKQLPKKTMIAALA